MPQKGLILKVNKNHLVILTDDHNYVKLNVKDHAVVGQKIFFNEEDICHSEHNSNWSLFDNKKFLSVASLFIAVILIGGIWSFNGHNNPTTAMQPQPEDALVATVLTIDINPSVKIALDQEDVVLSVIAVNADAKTLNFEGIVGMSAEAAVERIVTLARESSFINEDDLVDDYVLITTVPMNEKSEKNLDGLKLKLEEKITESPELQNVNVALMKAEKIKIFKAEGKKIPLGLYVVNGEVKEGDKTLTVKEYFSDAKRVEDFKEKGHIINKKRSKKIALAAKFIQKLEDAGVDGFSNLNDRLNNEDEDIDALLKEIKTLWATVEEDFEATDSENEGKDKSKDITEEATEGADEDNESGPPSDNPGKGNDKNKNKGN